MITMTMELIIHHYELTSERLHGKVVLQALLVYSALTSHYPQNFTQAIISRMMNRYCPDAFPRGTRFAVRDRLRDLIGAGAVQELLPQRYTAFCAPAEMRETHLATMLHQMTIARQMAEPIGRNVPRVPTTVTHRVTIRAEQQAR